MTEKNRQRNIAEELSRALLLSANLEPRTHEGALRLFSLHFVKHGPFPPECAHTLSKLMKYREEAEEISQRIRLRLAEKGYPQKA